jgi:predicted O-methyltransferase YrrM
VPYYLLYCPLRSPRTTINFLVSVYRRQRSKNIVDRNKSLVPTIEARDLFPGLFRSPVRLAELGSAPSGTTYFESYLLACLVQYLEARRVFEFGTSHGRTTLQLALNSLDDATIYTLDLPERACPTFYRRAFPEEDILRELPVGSLFRGHAESNKIKQLLADSAVADFDSLRGKIDLIFVDGDHSYDNVKNDSEKAFSMLSQSGVILWHDYGGRWSDVARYIGELASEKRGFYHLAGTSLAICTSSIPRQTLKQERANL